MRQSLRLFNRQLKALSSTRNTLRSTPTYSFSDLAKSAEQTRIKLADLLMQELEEEESNADREMTLDQEIKQFSTTHGWKFIVDPNTTRIEAQREIGDTQVKVFSRIRNELNPEDGEQGEENQQSDNEDLEADMEDTSADSFNEFKVVIQRAGKPKSLVFEMFMFGEERNIGSTYITDDVDTIMAFNDMMQQKSYYQGPQIETLEGKVQEGIYKYLDDIGVDNTFLSFFEMMTNELENRYYVKWLEDMNEYLS